MTRLIIVGRLSDKGLVNEGELGRLDAFRLNDRLSAVTTEATGFEPVEWFT
jgi:hypothetical protein